MVLPHCNLKLAPGHGTFIELVNELHKLQPTDRRKRIVKLVPRFEM
jgi:hypothetical protein